MKNEARMNLIRAADQLRLAQETYIDCMAMLIQTHARHQVGDVIDAKMARSGDACRAIVTHITGKMMHDGHTVCIDYHGHKLNRDGKESPHSAGTFEFVNLNEVS